MRLRPFHVFMALFTVCLFMSANVGVSAVTPPAPADSTIAVIAYFCKNDTMRYVRNKRVLTLENGDTIENKLKVSETFLIVVRDSTPEGYVMEFIPESLEYGEGVEDDVTAKLSNVLGQYFKNVTAVFTTDEYGQVTGLSNWKEIRDVMKQGAKAYLDSLYSAVDSLEMFMPRNKFEGLIKLMYSSEQGMLSNYSELSNLFSLHGNVFDIGKKTFDNSDKDSSVTTLFVGYTPPGEDSFDGDYNIIGSSVTRLTPEEVVDKAGGVLNILLSDSIAGEANKAFKDSLNMGMTITQLEDYYLFYNGWPRLMRIQKITEFGPRTKVETDETGWTFRSWGNYFAKEEDARGASYDF